MLAGVTVDELLVAILELEGGEHVTNFYRSNGCCPLPTDTRDAPAERIDRFRHHLHQRLDAPVVLVGEAAGWRGARQTGVPFTSPIQVGGSTGEASATVVQRALDELGLTDEVLLWNACLLHPHRSTIPNSNQAPPAKAIDQCMALLEEIIAGKLVVAVGRRAEQAVGRIVGGRVDRAGTAPRAATAVSVRHPSFGGAREFRSGLAGVAKHLYM